MAAYGTSDDYDPVSSLQTAFAELREVCETLLEVASSTANEMSPGELKRETIRKLDRATIDLHSIRF